jgi:signal transduction histidine kinase
VAARLRSHGLDALVVVLFLAAELWAAVTETDGSRFALYLLPVAWTLPLLARRRYPVAAILIVFVALALESQLAHEGTESFAALAAVLLAFWLAGNLPPRAAVPTAVAGAVCLYAIVSANPGETEAGDLLFVVFIALLPFVSGLIAAARERRAEADAISHERARIARDLHDVVGHALSLMTVQAGAARLRLEPEHHPALEHVSAIEETGREALAEMRRLVGVLREGGDAARDPQPDLAMLEPLLERVRAAGMAVELEVAGRREPLAPGVELAAYRIVQEALTNVRKHAGAARAVVTLTYRPDELAIEVADDGEPPAEPGAGHGLVGMRERAALYGGAVVAGPRPEGGFAVQATLPHNGGGG